MQQQIDLSGLKDVHIPQGGIDSLSSVFPISLGWWLLLIIIIAVPVIIYLIHFYRIRSAKLYALKQINELQQSLKGNAPKFAEEVSKLLKRIAILKFGKDKIASLSDKDWVAFLIKTGNLSLPENLISLFAYSPYAKVHKSDKDSINVLRKAAELWIRKNT